MSTPFLRIEPGSDERFAGGDSQVVLINLPRHLLAIEFVELENEAFDDRWPVQGEAIKIDRRVRTVGTLTEDRHEGGEVFRFQESIRVAN
jgi:hypothetical protein